MSHCKWCSDPFRAVILGLASRGLRACVITRHYGLRRTTVTMALQRGRRDGCIPAPTCRYCKVGISPHRLTCAKQACVSARDRDSSRLRRARYGNKRRGPRRTSSAYVEPPDFEWPELPPNRRERNERVPCPVEGAPIRYRASLLGVGHKAKALQDAAIAAYWAGVKQAAFPVATPTPKAITPFRPLASPEPEGFWAATRVLRASGRTRPAGTFIPAPPMCPTIGTLVHGSMAA